MNDELRRVISIAQNAHDRNGGPADNTAVIIGALIRAVTILAGERPTLHEEAINVCKEMRDAAVRAFSQTSSVDNSFSGDLVDVLIEAFVRGTKNGALPTREGVRAILSELALIPIELPSQGQIIQAMRDEVRGWGPERAIEFTRERIAHFLNAQKVRIADLEQHTATLEGLARQYKTERDHVEETCKIQRERIDVLEKRLAEETAPLTVDGKTPGQVFGDAFRNGFGKRVVRDPDSELVRIGGELRRDYKREQELDWANAMEIGAWAVLRAFGPAMAKQAAVGALGRVRERLVKSGSRDPREWVNPGPWPQKQVLAIIDDEIASLDGTKS